MKLYLAGPMRGYEMFNFPAFDDWQDWLEGYHGHTVISPAEMDRDREAEPEFDEKRAPWLPEGFLQRAMRRDVEALLVVDGIALMPGWEQSKGVEFELSVAKMFGLKAIVLDDSGVTRTYTEGLAESISVPSTNGNRAGHPRFHELVKEIGDLHDKKQRDYGTANDPFANVRGSEQWGIPAWVGAMVRANDKIKRLQNFAQKGELANESAEDSFRDLAVYALIALVLYEESSGAAVERAVEKATAYA